MVIASMYDLSLRSMYDLSLKYKQWHTQVQTFKFKKSHMRASNSTDLLHVT